MTGLPGIHLNIITENQSQKIKAEKLSELIKQELGDAWCLLSIESYDKFENSYKIEFQIFFCEEKKDEINLLAIKISDKLASPWLVYFDKNDDTIELIYNKSDNNRVRKAEFNVIKWASLQTNKNHE